MVAYKMISKATLNLGFGKIYGVILLCKDKLDIHVNRNNCFGLPLAMVAYVFKGLFTHTNLCQTMHTYTIYSLYQDDG